MLSNAAAQLSFPSWAIGLQIVLLRLSRLAASLDVRPSTAIQRQPIGSSSQRSLVTSKKQPQCSCRGAQNPPAGRILAISAAGMSHCSCSNPAMKS